LKEVHAIKIPSYGSIDLKRDSHGNFSEWKMKSSMEGVRKMDDKLQFTEGDYKNMEKVLSELNDIESRFSPVLIHGDPWPINCIMSEQGMVVVDWDEAHASIWLADLANVTYINDPISLDDQRMQEKINSFLAGYGQTNLSYEEIKKGIRSLHLLNAISLIMYHYYHTNNDEELILAKNKILTLL